MESRNRIEQCLDLLGSQPEPLRWSFVVIGGIIFGGGLVLGIFAVRSTGPDFGAFPNSALGAMFFLQGVASLRYGSRRTLATTLRLLSLVAMIVTLVLLTMNCYSLFGPYAASVLFATFVVFFGSIVFYRCRRTLRE